MPYGLETGPGIPANAMCHVAHCICSVGRQTEFGHEIVELIEVGEVHDELARALPLA